MTLGDWACDLQVSCERFAPESTAIGAGVHAIVNFAAETHVDRSILSPEAFLRTDILGTHVLLEAVRKHGISRYLQVSTDEVYGDVSEGESSENDTLRPRSPYSASKAGGDLQVLAYWTTYSVPVIITRGSNTYGPYQYPEKLIPLFVTNLIDDQQVPLYGDGLQIRDWLHVEDHARGIMHALEHGEIGNVYNIGVGANISVLELVAQLNRLLGTSIEPQHGPPRPGDVRHSQADITRARRDLGYDPTVDFAEGLRRTVEWYQRSVGG